MQILTEGDRASLSLGGAVVGGRSQPAAPRQDTLAAAQLADSYGQQQPSWAADSITAAAAEAQSALLDGTATSVGDTHTRAAASDSNERSGPLDLPAPFADRSNLLTPEATSAGPPQATPAAAAAYATAHADSSMPHVDASAGSAGSAEGTTWGAEADAFPSDAAPQRSWESAGFAERYVPDSYQLPVAERAAVAAGLASNTSSIPGDLPGHVSCARAQR